MNASGEMSRDAGDELVMLVDACNNPVGAVSRREMRRRGLPHRATYVLVFDSRGRIFVHKRTETKDIYPGWYDLAAGGVVLAGESWDESARRELAEELGITQVVPEPLFEFEWRDARNHVFGKAYRVTWDGPMLFQPEEVAGGEFWEIRDVLAAAERGEQFTPDGLWVLRRVVGGLEGER